MEDFIYSWKFSDKKERSTLWYILAVAIVIGIAIWWITTSQYGLTFIIILAAGVFFFVENNTSDEIEVFLNDVGIKIDSNFYEYSKIQSYSYVFVEENPVQIELLINKKWLKTTRLTVDKNIYSQLQMILPKFLEEWENLELSSSEKIINFLKL